jgi:tRNA(Ile)-lysidine synthetase-like protein
VKKTCRPLSRYSKPGEVGGRLIREFISFYRAQQLRYPESPLIPISSHILIAVSGGADSVALARLLIRYGRKVGDRRKIRLIHINHRWRGAESDDDELFVRTLARDLGVSITVVRLKPRKTSPSESLEDQARRSRKKIYLRLSEKYQAPVFTAHHADDLAETLIWRLLTGTARSHGAGISFKSGPEIRPFLRVRKNEMKAFLEEEGQDWREDRTNHEGRFLRSKLRQEAMPALESIFPKMVVRLVEQALVAQKPKNEPPSSLGPEVLFGAAGLYLRSSHHKILEELKERLKGGKTTSGELSLPEGWKLKWQTSSGRQRWILERA